MEKQLQRIFGDTSKSFAGEGAAPGRTQSGVTEMTQQQIQPQNIMKEKRGGWDLPEDEPEE